MHFEQTEKTETFSVKKISFALPAINRLDAAKEKSICLFLFEEKKPIKGISGLVDWRLLGLVSKHIINGFITGKKNEAVLFHPGQRLPQTHVFILGLGSRDNFNHDQFCSAIDKMLNVLSDLKCNSVITSLPGRTENICKNTDAILWFLDHLNNNLSKIPADLRFTIVEPKQNHSVMIPVVERWRMKHSLLI